jgi:hypothetical protein
MNAFTPAHEERAICPVTGERAPRERFLTCSMCREAVSPLAFAADLARVEKRRCFACRRLTKVRKDDPRMARVLHEHPRLDDWSRWRLSETARVYILVASRLAGKLLVVLDKETLSPKRVAESGPFLMRWSDLPEVQREAELR